MWIFNLKYSFGHIVFFSLYSLVISMYGQFSTNYQYIPNEPSQGFTSENVLTNNFPPAVARDLPSSVTFMANETLMLSCNIDGRPTPHYQWYKSKNDLTQGYFSIQDQKFERIPAGNSKTLRIEGNSTTKNYSKYIYYCSAQNRFGILQTNKIIVEKVTEPLTVKLKLSSYAVYEGGKYVAQCKLEPDLVPLFKFYCWRIQLKGRTICLNQTEGRFSVINSTKIPQLHIRDVTNDDFRETKIRCIYQRNIINHYEEVISDSITVEKYAYNFGAPTSLTCSGETVTATVGTNIELPWCTSPQSLNATWYKVDNHDLKKRMEISNKVDDSKFKVVNRHYGNLLILNVTKADSGTYVAESMNKRLAATFTLIVYEPPAINLEPKTIQKKLSESAEFNCSATFSKSQFQWLHNGRTVANGYDDGNIEVVSTFNTSYLRVKSTRLSVSGVYQCIATSMDEMKRLTDYKQISGTLLLSEIPPILVKQSPRVERGSAMAHVQVKEGHKIKTIECVFAANPIPTIVWYYNSKKIPITKNIVEDIKTDSSSIYNLISRVTIDLNEIDSPELWRDYAGEYEARAQNSIGTASCYAFILTPGFLQLVPQSVQEAIGKKDYLFTCFFKANGVPEFFWERRVDKSDIWETLPVNHRTNVIEKGYKLILKNVIKEEDEGIYRCKVKDSADNRAMEIRLVVVYPPYLQNLPSKHDRSQIQTHVCTLRSAANRPWYTWWTFTRYNSNETKIIEPNRNDAPYSVYYQNPTHIEPPGNVNVPEFVLRFPNVGADLSVKARSNDDRYFGKFVCHAKNHIGSDEKSIEDNFLRLEFKVVPPSSSEVVVGEDLFLDCTAKESDLNPIVKWRLPRDNMYVDINNFKAEHNGRIFQYDNGTLVMRSIKETDPSKLLCFIFPASKSDMVQSKISYIEIRVPARILQFKKEIYKEVGSSFNLSCNVYGHNSDLKINWYYKSKDIPQWKELYQGCIYSSDNQCIVPYQVNSGNFNPINDNHNRTYHTLHLEFRDSEERISGEYMCQARNKYNTALDQTSTRLIMISKPSVVQVSPSQNEPTSTSIEFEWKPPEKDGNRPILGYIINYYEVSNRTYNVDHINVTQKTIRVNHTVQSIIIDQLRPNKKYVVSVSAQNEVGISEAVPVPLMTQEAKPQRAVNGLRASSTKPDEILISWSDPDPEFQNGHISRYQMCYQIIPSTGEPKSQPNRLNWPENSADMNQFQNVICQEVTKTSIIVPNLPQFTDFGIRVIAYNSKGASPAAFTKVRTLEDLPQAPPSSVTCEGQQQSIMLTWNPPARQTINGVLIGYAVYYYQPNKYRDESGMKSVIVQGRTNVIIDQLKPFTAYSIQVMASNRKGLGPASVSVVCQTKEAKPEAPEVVKAVKINNTCVAVSWLHTKNPNGKILSYCVTVSERVDRPDYCQPPDMNKRYNMRVICDHDERFPTIKVLANNYYPGATKEVQKIEEINGIISIGGEINVHDGASITLPCETLSDTPRTLQWKKDNRDFIESEYTNMKILPNKSLQISPIDSSIDRYGRYGTYQCSTDSDAIEYTLNVQEPIDSSPGTPIIDETIVTENSIFIRWKSRGTSDISAPITGFIVKVENLYTGDSKTLELDENKRSFYLNNVTCASDFQIQISSKSGIGKSKYSDSKRLRTQGTAPQFADSSILLPQKNIEAHSANFYLLAFGPGDNCSAMYFTIDISLTSSGRQVFTDLIVTKNISVYDLENKCCYKVTGLNPMSRYQYRVTAFNPAGSVTSENAFATPGTPLEPPGYNSHGASTTSFVNQSWLLMIILVIVIIFVLIFVIVGVLYILRSKEKKSQSVPIKPQNKRSDFNQNRIEKPINQDDNASIDSEPSPYAVYQPDAEQKIPCQIWPQQVSQQSSTPQYNYPEHSYYQIRYDKIAGRPTTLDNHHDNYRRANSAECLSSLGNASVVGNADLESPSNIDQNVSQDYFRAPFTHVPDTDEVFQNIRYPDFSTVNRKRIRRESENLNRYLMEEAGRFLPNGVNQGAMSRSRYYEPSNSQVLQQPHQARQLYQTTGNAHNFRQQMSVPEPASVYHQQYGYPSNRLRTSSGTGRNHPSSQNVVPSNPGSSAQVNGYGSYYGTRANNIQPYSTSSGIRRDNESQNNQYSSYITGSGNYQQIPRGPTARPTLDRIESPDEGIYTDRVVVV